MSDALLPRLQESVALLSNDVERAIAQLGELYVDTVEYENPIQHVVGLEAFLGLMRHMATRWTPFAMEIDDGLESDCRIYGRFRLTFRPGFLKRSLEIEGVTRCVVAAGRITAQRDYYDAMSSALDSIPLAGPAYRKIISQFNVR